MYYVGAPIPQGKGHFWGHLSENTGIFGISQSCLKCFDTVGGASGRASGLQKSSDEVLMWLSVCSEVQIVCI